MYMYSIFVSCFVFSFRAFFWSPAHGYELRLSTYFHTLACFSLFGYRSNACELKGGRHNIALVMSAS